jgi:hypothetical protein
MSAQDGRQRRALAAADVDDEAEWREVESGHQRRVVLFGRASHPSCHLSHDS